VDEVDRLGVYFNDMAKQITRQFSDLKKSDQVRRELIANVSHDLRTPLATLHGYLETLELKFESLDPVQRKEYLDIALRQSERLGKLVSELFELAKLDSYETSVNNETFSIGELTQDIMQKFQLQAQKRKVQLSVNLQENIGLVMGDIAMIQRVLENLLENALRHTPSGGRVSVSMKAKADGIQVSIEDTGKGIPAQELPKIFERFYQLEKSRNNDAQGAGLGLAICRRIVELHGSKLQVASELGKGTIFSFQIPIQNTG
jgi:signal transduction histidine kinase